SPNLSAVCDGQGVNATITAGSGGTGCSDSYEFSTDGGTTWSAYTSGANISTTGLAGTSVQIRVSRGNCTSGAGCNGTGWSTIATWNVNAQPSNASLNVKSPNLSAVCDGQDVNATITAGSGGTGCSDSYEFSTDGGTTWSAYTSGANISSTGRAGTSVN